MNEQLLRKKKRDKEAQKKPCGFYKLDFLYGKMDLYID